MVIVTVLELLKLKFPSDYVVAIIANMDTDDKIMLDEETQGRVLDELEDLFDWQKSKEGYQFWADVFDAVANGEQLPKLPMQIGWKPDTYLCLDTGSYLLNAGGEGEEFFMELDFSEKPRTVVERFFKEKHLSFLN